MDNKIILLSAVLLFQSISYAQEKKETREDLIRRNEYFERERLDNTTGKFNSALYDKARLELQRIRTARSSGIAAATLPGPAWEYFGPIAVPTGHIGMGKANCVAIDPTNKNIIYIGSSAGGIFKSTNGGSTWTPKSDKTLILSVSDIAINRQRPNNIFVASGDVYWGSGTLDLPKTKGILVSDDGGNTWQANPIFPPASNGNYTELRRLLIDPADSNKLYACTDKGFYTSSDKGATWTNRRTGFFNDAEFTVSSSNVIYTTYLTSGNVAQVYKYTVSSNSWTNITPPSLTTTFKSTGNGIVFGAGLQVAVTNANASAIWVYAVAGTVGEDTLTMTSASSLKRLIQVLKSTDNGTTWTEWLAPKEIVSTWGHFSTGMAVSPWDENKVVISGINVALQTGTSSAMSWKTISRSVISGTTTQFIHVDNRNIEFYPYALNASLTAAEKNYIYICNDGGSYRADITSNFSTTANPWTDLSNQLYISQFYHIAVSGKTASMASGALQDNGNMRLLTASSSNHMNDGAGDGFDVLINQTDDNNIISLSNSGLPLKRSTDGVSFTDITPVAPSGNKVTGGIWAKPIMFDAKDPNVLFYGADTLYFSVNQGAGWFYVTGLSLGQGVRSMHSATKNAGVVYVAGANGNFYRITRTGNTTTTVNLSSNIASSIAPGLQRISSICTDPDNENIVYISLSGFTNATPSKHIFKSTDAGVSWSNYGNNLPDIPVNSIVFERNTSEALYAGTDLGVFYRNASLGSWSDINNLLPNVIVSDLEINYLENKLYVGTHGRGIWRVSLYNVCATGKKTVKGIYDDKRTYNFVSADTVEAISQVASATPFNLKSAKVIVLKHGFRMSGSNGRFYIDPNACLGGVAKGSEIYAADLPGIKEENNLPEPVLVYPNPFRDQLTIRPPKEANADLKEVHIYNMNGVLLFESALENQRPGKINTASLKPGIYICEVIMSNGKAYRQKIMKL